MGTLKKSDNKKASAKGHTHTDAHFRNLVDNAVVGIADTSLSGQVLYANRAMLNLLDFKSLDQMKKTGTLFLWRDLKRREEFVFELQKQGCINNYDVEVLTRKGTTIHLLVSATFDGDVISSMVTDVTERTIAGIALSESREKLAEAEQIARMGFLHWDLSTNECTLSDTVYSLFGITTGTTISAEKLTALVHPDDRDFVVNNLNMCIRGEGEYDIDHRIVRPDGTIVWVHGRADVQRDEDGAPISVIGTSVDISERKAVEDELVLRGEVVANMSEGVHVVRAEDGIIIFTNPAFDKAFGYGPNELLGKHVTILNAPTGQDPNEVARKIYSAIDETGHWEGDVCNARKDGSVFWCEIHATGFDHSEHGKAFVTVRTDITERRKMEKENALLLDEASKRLKELECIYGISNLVRIRESIDEILQDAVAVIPSGWRYQEITCCRLRYEDKEWFSGRFEETDWKQSSHLTIADKPCGSIEVFYLEERPTLDEGPFMAEERLLLDGIASVLSEAIERKLSEESLRASEAQLRMIYEHAPVMINAFDADGRCIMWNKECERVLGWTAEEMFAQESPMDIFYPEPDIRQKVIDSITAHPSPEFMEWRPKTKTGSEAICLWANFMSYEGQVFSLGYDITERKRAEELLVENKKDLLDAQALAHIGNWSWDVKEDVISWSDEVYRIYKINPDTPHTYERLREAIHPEDRDYHDTLTAGWLKGDRPEPFQYRVVHADGSVRYVYAVGEVEFDDEGEPTKMFGVVQDITEQTRSEEMLREREATLHALLNAPLDTIILVARDGTVLSINEGGARKLGRSTEDLIGRNIYQIMDDETAEYRKERGETVFNSGQPVHFNDQRMGMHFANSVYPVFDSLGEQVDRVAIFSTDITERIQVEQRLEKYQQRLKSMASQLILAEEQARRRIAADLHDNIGQSLALMRLQLAATRKDLPEGSTQDVQLADISQSLLNAIHDTRHLIFELSSPSLNELGLGPAIAEWIEENAKNKSGPRVNLVDESQDTPLTQDLRAILFRNIRELLTNTIKHANAKSVSILLEGTAGQLTVTVQDNGRGFDPDASLSGANSGSGYGLFSIHERMSDLGGSFEIVSLPGMGCKAVLNVPINADIQAMQA